MTTASGREIDARIRDLDARVDLLVGDTEPDPRAKAEGLRALEQDLRALARGTVLADTGRWRDLAREADAPAANEAADDLLGRLMSDAAAEWGAAHPPAPGAGPDAAFRVLADARHFDLDALSLRRTRPPLADERPRLQEALVLAVEQGPPPGDAVRDAWAAELLDQANAVLTDADEVPAPRAQARLALVANDLEWHAAHVETRRGRRRTRLRWKARRLRAEGQERDLQHRLEERYGAGRVATFDRVVFWLIVLVLALLGIELLFDLPQPVDIAFMVVDTLACGVFLWDVGVRLRFVRGRLWWFSRHFLVDVLPSLPFAMALRAFRAIRLFRLARFFRVFGFLTRGSDRIVRKYGYLLNRDVILYPTREERREAQQEEDGPEQQARRVQTRLNARWERLLTTAPMDAREDVARIRLAGLEAVRAAGQRVYRPAATGGAAGDLPAEDLLQRLASLTAEEIEAEVGQDFVIRVARWVRLFSLPPIRWFPVLRRYVPRVPRSLGSAEVVAAAAHSAAKELKRHHDRWFWFADLYGTVTPAQFVDRIGTTMVRASLRPAYRLVLFGLIVLVFKVLFGFSHIGFLKWMADAIFGFVGILGSICIAVLGTGWWLRRIAGQATDFFRQSARAQYLTLTESIKGRHIDRDASILDRHVFAAERVMTGADGDTGDRIRFIRGIRRWLIEAQPGDGITSGFDPVERAVLMYRDGIDGALLCESDMRTTGQLLGNPALRNLRALSGRFGPAERKAIQRLDLARQKSLFSGPYLWFSLVCQAVAHGAARLIVDYNRFALPLDQLDDASAAERAQYDAWLRAEHVADVPSEQVLYVTTTFTALHFLDDDPDRDREVELRFGKTILERMRRDRRHLFRRIFGTYPLHQRPRNERVVNLFELYQSRFAGGRSLLLLFRVPWEALRYCGRFFLWLRRCIREIRRPSFQVDAEAARGADYPTALRKIHRMRGPVAEEAIRKRARFDPEYLGLRLPGTARSGLEQADARADLRFLDSGARFAVEVEQDRLRAARDLVRLGRLYEGGLWERVARVLDADPAHLGREHRRAAAAAYVADLSGVRRHLSSLEILAEVYERAARREALPPRILPKRRLRQTFARYWSERGAGDNAARRAAWRATRHNVDGVAHALAAWGARGDAARDDGVRILADLLRHPERITDQLVTLRIVQTLSLIDVLNYREHVYRMGRYADDADEPGGSLELR